MASLCPLVQFILQTVLWGRRWDPVLQIRNPRFRGTRDLVPAARVPAADASLCSGLRCPHLCRAGRCPTPSAFTPCPGVDVARPHRTSEGLRVLSECCVPAASFPVHLAALSAHTSPGGLPHHSLQGSLPDPCPPAPSAITPLVSGPRGFRDGKGALCEVS